MALGDREPVRVPIWASTVLAVVTGAAVDLLGGLDWRSTLIGVLLGLGPLYGAEIARQRAWSPLSVWKATADARADERAKEPPIQVLGRVGRDEGRADLVTIGLFLLLLAMAWWILSHTPPGW